MASRSVLPPQLRPSWIGRSGGETLHRFSPSATFRRTLTLSELQSACTLCADAAPRPASLCRPQLRKENTTVVTLGNLCRRLDIGQMTNAPSHRPNGPFAASSRPCDSLLLFGLTGKTVTSTVDGASQQNPFSPQGTRDAYNDTPQHLLEGITASAWGKPFFGNVFNAPRNFPYRCGKYWGRRQYMKKHRYQKRYKFQRLKVAAIAGLPVARKLRINMVPILRSNKGALSGKTNETRKADMDVDGLTASASAAANAQQSRGASGNNKMRRPRPKSLYTS